MAWWEKGGWLSAIRVYWRSGALPGHYRDVFTGRGTDIQSRIVLADLVRESRFFHSGEGLVNEDQQFNAGKRHMMTYILAKLRFVPHQTQQLGNPEFERGDNE